MSARDLYDMSHNQRVELVKEIVEKVSECSTQDVQDIINTILNWDFYCANPYKDTKQSFYTAYSKAMELAMQAGAAADDMDSGEEIIELGNAYQQHLVNESSALCLMSILRFYYFHEIPCLLEAKTLYGNNMIRTVS